jgi:hypothetical protein
MKPRVSGITVSSNARSLTNPASALLLASGSDTMMSGVTWGLRERRGQFGFPQS